MFYSSKYEDECKLCEWEAGVDLRIGKENTQHSRNSTWFALLTPRNITILVHVHSAAIVAKGVIIRTNRYY